MKILNIRTVSGPNTFHRKSVLVMTVDLEDRAETPSNEVPGFTERLLELVPGLSEHRCSLGYPGGFVERLKRGTYFAHIAEHVALELSGPAGIEVGFGKAINGGRPGIYQVIVRYVSENAMKHLLHSAVEIVEACAKGESYDVASAVNTARKIAEEERFGPSTQALVDAAEKRGIPWRRLNSGSLIEFGYGSKKKRVWATITGLSSQIAVDIAQDKDLTKSILDRMELPVPRGKVVSSAEEAILAFETLGGSVVVKPRDGNHGNGISLDLTESTTVREAFDIAREFSSSVIVEEFFHGKDFRALVVGGKLVAVAERIPASVVGDGVHSVTELIEIENRNPLRGEGHEKPMTRIKLDRATLAFLARSGIDLATIPPVGENVRLANTANLSRGGTAHDVTSVIHPEVARICERAARAIGLDVCGIDLVLPDITCPLTNQRGGIIEVNAAPGIRMHHYPASGRPRDVGGAIIDHLFPIGENGRIPIVSVTGTNGKTTVTRLIGHLLNENRYRVGMTTSTGISVGGVEIASGDTTGPTSARMVLEDPAVDVAVLETARGGILRRGLGYDWSDVGVLTNVQPDHIGQDGIETVEDILRIKSLVADRVREGGTLVLNAEDPLVAGLAETPEINAEKKHLTFFGLSEENPILIAHREKGGDCYFVRGTQLIESLRGREIVLGDTREVPITVLGTAGYQIANVLAATAAGRAMGLSIEQVWRGLTSFSPIVQNSGRANFYRVKNGIVIVDYGHNPGALRAVLEMTRRWNARRVTGIISAPGDRSDEVIRLSGQTAAEGFDRIIIREDANLRGRALGVTARLLWEGVYTARPGLECVLQLDETQAIAKATESMVDGEVIVFFYDSLDAVTHALKQVDARPVHDFLELSFLLGKQGPVEMQPLRLGSGLFGQERVV